MYLQDLVSYSKHHLRYLQDVSVSGMIHGVNLGRFLAKIFNRGTRPVTGLFFIRVCS